MVQSERFGWIGSVLVCVVLVFSGQARGQVSPDEVERRIKRAVAWLYTQQNKDGDFEKGEPAHKQHGGFTAIATYALLAAGESHQDPRLQKAINWLANAKMEGTYAVGLRAQVWGFLPQTPAVRAALARDADILIKSMRGPNSKEARGMYHYEPKGNDYDHSCSNYGVLGMWAVAQANFEVPTRYWEEVDTAWREHQQPDGGWSYKNDDKHIDSKMSMTTAGIATLFITQDYLYAMNGVNCQGNIVDMNIERGIKWIADRAKNGLGDHYSHYNIERVGVASGLKYFGTVDWYQVGAKWLISKQNGDGSCAGERGPIPDTSWTIVFLVRGRAPVMMNKLEYGLAAGKRSKPAMWNQRPRDIANLVRWMGKQIEKDLNWQIVNLSVDVDELHDAPILYMSGKEAISLQPAEVEKLKRFVEQGGLIVGNADCSSGGFAKSFRDLGTSMFGAEFRALPDDHPIYTAQQYQRSQWKRKPVVLGLSNGVRELMILFPTDDPARGWQMQAFMGDQREPLSQVMANIFLYAVDKQNLRYKGETYLVKANPQIKPVKPIRVARLQYKGAWNPEPGGWQRLAAVLHNRNAALTVETVKLGEGQLSSSYQAAHLTGTVPLKLDDEARKEIRRYVDGGGTLVVDAAGGNSEFGLSAFAEMKQIFPESGDGPTPLAPTHLVYTTGDRIEEVEYRSYARRTVGSTRQARLRGIDVGGKTRVFFSAEDLSAGLVGQPVDGIVGYAPSATKTREGKFRYGATELMSNILFHASGGAPPPPTTQPAKGATKPGSQPASPANKK